jgi:two-component system, cell cycle response regulator CtrA
MMALYSDRPDASPDPAVINQFICHLRRKLKEFGVSIHTVWGHGYRISLADRLETQQVAA